jgi:hypothetical protein
MTNTQLYLSIGIPSVLIILAWLSNRQDLRDLSSRMDRMDTKIDRHYENFNNQVTTLLTAIHTVSERVTRLEGKQ